MQEKRIHCLKGKFPPELAVWVMNNYTVKATKLIGIDTQVIPFMPALSLDKFISQIGISSQFQNFGISSS